MLSTLIVEFEVDRPQLVTGIVRRVKHLAAMLSFGQKSRARLGKAVGAVLRDALERQRATRVSLGLAIESEGHWFEVRIRDFGPITPAVAARPPSRNVSPAISVNRLGELVDRFDMTGWPGNHALVCLALQLPLSFSPPVEGELQEWQAVMEAPSADDALALLYAHVRTRLASVSDAKSRARLRRGVRKSGEGRESLDLLSMVASKTDNSVAILDRDAVVEWVNDSFTTMTGLTQRQCEGQSVGDLLFGQENAVEGAIRLRAVLNRGQGATEEFLSRRVSGNHYWCTLNLTPVHDERGDLVRWVIIGADTTRKHEAQRALESAKREAETANRAKSEFLAAISHEIRTPMNAIIGMTELVLATPLTSEQSEYLTTVKQAADSLLKLLNDILDLSKIEATKLEIDAVSFNLADLLRETMRTMELQAELKGLQLNWSLPLSVPQQLIGDPSRLRQILINLVGNAIKFTTRGSVSVDVTSDAVRDASVDLRIAVRDTGIGIPLRQQKMIFEAFHQGDAATSRSFGGTGLGLTITAELLRLMGGRIWVESQEGEGSSFYVSLSLSRDAHENTVAVAERREMLQDHPILLITDDEEGATQIGQMLQRMGVSSEAYRPKFADERARIELVPRFSAQESKRDSLEAIAGRVDGALINVNDAETAFQVLQQLHTNVAWRGKSLFLVTTSQQRQRMLTYARTHGLRGVLTEPLSPNSLSDAFLMAYRKEQALSEIVRRVVEGDVSPTERAPSLRVLVVDDHATNRQLVSAILSRRGHFCDEAEHGDEALRRLQQRPYDLIVMDLQMPVLDGYQTTHAIRSMTPESSATSPRVPIIALTAYAMKGDREKCLAAGMDGYLPKPIHAHDLIQAVESLGDSGAVAMRSPIQQGDATIGSAGNEYMLPVPFVSPQSSLTLDRLQVAEPLAANKPLLGEERSSRSVAAPDDFSHALTRLANDEGLLISQMQLFLDELPALWERLEHGVISSDAKTVEIVAHRLRSLLAAYDADTAANHAQQLELLGRSHKLVNGEKLVRELKTQVDSLVVRVQQFLARHGTGPTANQRSVE